MANDNQLGAQATNTQSQDQSTAAQPCEDEVWKDWLAWDQNLSKWENQEGKKVRSLFWELFWPLKHKVITFPILIVLVLATVASMIVWGPATWEIWLWDASSWQSIFVGVAGVLLVTQVFLLNRQLRSVTFSLIQGRVIDVNKIALDHQREHLFSSLNDTAFSSNMKDSPERDLSDLILVVFEELFCQYHLYHLYHLVDDTVWEGWVKMMKHYMTQYEFLKGYI